MKLPNGEHAIVSLGKLIDYCLNTEHESGKHKAQVFSSVLGVTIADAEWLRDVLLNKARDAEAVRQASSQFGDRYTVDFELQREGRVATVRSSWIILKGELVPRLSSCFIRRRETKT